MPRHTLRPPPIFALKIKRKISFATPRTPFGVPLQRRKAAQKQCADNHLRPKGARIENPLYLAIPVPIPVPAQISAFVPSLFLRRTTLATIAEHVISEQD
jgi:hypothetical protein